LSMLSEKEKGQVLLSTVSVLASQKENPKLLEYKKREKNTREEYVQKLMSKYDRDYSSVAEMINCRVRQLKLWESGEVKMNEHTWKKIQKVFGQSTPK
jgi:ribosome-binding protein aMBF1 (putative translation factor)